VGIENFTKFNLKFHAMENTNPILRKATFNPKFKTYIFLVVLFYMIITVVGIVLVPFWVFGLGSGYQRNSLEH